MKSLKEQIKRVSRTGLIVGSVAGALVAPQAFAASGTVNVDIDFPPLLILYYYDDIPINVDAASFATATGLDLLPCTADAPGLECSLTPTAPTVSATAGVISTSTNITGDAPAPTLDTSLSFDINNAWAVRSLGLGTLDATITQGGGDFVAASATSDLEGSGTVASSLTLSAGNNVGDLQFEVDLTTLADARSASDTITITVVPSP